MNNFKDSIRNFLDDVIEYGPIQATFILDSLTTIVLFFYLFVLIIPLMLLRFILILPISLGMVGYRLFKSTLLALKSETKLHVQDNGVTISVNREEVLIKNSETIRNMTLPKLRGNK